MTGIKAAVLRQTRDGVHPNGWYPERKISLAQALAGYTRARAHAGFMDRESEPIAPGFLADFVVLDQDLFAAGPAELDRAKVLRTIVGGVQRFG